MLSFVLVLPLAMFSAAEPIQPIPWPLVFHAHLNRSGLLAGDQAMEIFYDWLGGRQVEVFNKKGKLSHANHRANGSLYTYSPGIPGCKIIQFKYGLLRPDWMQNGTYKGRQTANGKECDVWALAPLLPGKHLPFLTYFDDASTGAMVRETFFVGVTDDVIDLHAGEMGSDDMFQIPADCFKNSTEVYTDLDDAVMDMSPFALMRYGIHLDIGPTSCYDHQNVSSCTAHSPSCHWCCQPERLGKPQDCVCSTFVDGPGCDFRDIVI